MAAPASLVLASGSPRRRELLEDLGFVFDIDPSGVDEKALSWTHSREFALKAALAKGSDVARRHEGALVISADTIVCVGDEILGKPDDRDHARRMLLRLRGRKHQVITGIAVVREPGGLQLDAESTTVVFRDFDDQSLEKYLDTGESLDKAGAYGIQGHGGSLVDRIEGDYFNVVGLPLSRLLGMLESHLDVRAARKRLAGLEEGRPRF